MNDHSATAVIPTKSASRYLQQLCKHRAHKFEVAFTATDGRIVFPRDVRGAGYAADAAVTFRARDSELEVHVAASEARQLDGVKNAVASHLDRFAFREAPLPFDWR